MTLNALKERAEKLNDSYYTSLDRELKKSHTYVVDVIPVMKNRIDLGNGNYVKSKLIKNDN